MSAYQIAVSGVLSDVVRSVFRDVAMRRTPASTVLRIRVDPGQGPAEIAQRLLDRRLVVLSIRPLPLDRPGPGGAGGDRSA